MQEPKVRAGISTLPNSSWGRRGALFWSPQPRPALSLSHCSHLDVSSPPGRVPLSALTTILPTQFLCGQDWDFSFCSLPPSLPSVTFPYPFVCPLPVRGEGRQEAHRSIRLHSLQPPGLVAFAVLQAPPPLSILCCGQMTAGKMDEGGAFSGCPPISSCACPLSAWDTS